jgi:hypothetical protein
MPPRPFADDYKGGAPADGSGTLTQTMDGKPVTARYVVGRREVGQPDVALTPGGVDAVSAEVLGAVPRPIAKREISGDAGRYIPGVDPVTGDPASQVLFAKNLPPGVRDDTIVHEVGHADTARSASVLARASCALASTKARSAAFCSARSSTLALA